MWPKVQARGSLVAVAYDLRGAVQGLSELRGVPNGLELSCPAEAGRPCRTVRLAGRPGKIQSSPSPPGQPKVLVISQGFSELLGGAYRRTAWPAENRAEIAASMSCSGTRR